ncbi:hypothetical protein AAG570_001770 [Ranatra chinensis]|uniref:Lysosomal dipeptide transporter MFSD1 n=1 Tax=Ranatra chinensis TaxID=642074 RepID=A0ABD0Y9H7_9HEMI
MCFLGFGSYFCYDNPGALQDVIIRDLSLSTTEFTYLYSSYSWPNFVLCFIGGFLIDRVFGIRLGTVIYAMIVVLGQLVFSFGVFCNSFWLMIVGRVIFGIGGESLAVAQNYYAVLWFKGKELNMVFGFQLSFARIGSAVNFFIMGPIYDFVSHYYKGYQCLGIVLFVASSTCLVSFICSLSLAYLDKKVKSNSDDENKGEDEVAKLSDLKDFSAAFWLITVICVSYYVAIFPFIALGKVFFMRKFDLVAGDANFINSLIYVVSSVASPLLGLMIDKTGRNVFWVSLAIVITIGSHSLLAFTFLNPFIGMMILGFSYSLLASALWPMIALVVQEYQLGSAYGIAQALQNLGLAFTTWFAGMVVDSGGYLMLEVFFLVWLCVALIAALFMWIYDLRTSGVLNMTVAQRNIYERSKLASEKLQRESQASGSINDVSPYDVTQPQSDFNIRNRYLARIGATTVSTIVCLLISGTFA